MIEEELMDNMEIKQYQQLNSKQQEKVLDIFIDGFRYLFTFAKSEQELKQLFASAFHPSLVYACIEEDKVLGMLGIATKYVRPIKLELELCIKMYGKFKGTILYKQMNGIFQSQVVKEETDLYIDVLATAKEERGRGVASKLLNYAFTLGNYKDFWIEVLSKNSNAKRLYEKIGFKEYKKNRITFVLLLGYGYPIKMKYEKK